MLGSADVVAFVPTRDPKRARQFYEDVIGLEFVSEDPFALVFRAHGSMIRVANVSGTKGFKPAPYTILGWSVLNAEETASELAANDVRFERFPGIEQNDAGIWRSPSGAQVAWFKDPDGNLLSITQMP